MKKSNRTKIIGLFTLVLTVLTLSSCITIGTASTDDIISEIDQFKEKIKDIPKNCWRKPAILRKWVIYIKLSIIKRLVLKEKFEDAYDKFLYSIKPKLTGLKTDENEVPWGNGVFKRPWIVCEEVREELRVKCNIILALIKLGPQQPADDTPPEIFIQYDGSNDENDPGEWSVYLWDEESGLGEAHITISVGGEIYNEIQEDLRGMEFKEYDISIPAIAGIYTVHVIVKNDISYDGVQETNEAEQSVEIEPYVPPEPL